jgi:hypothetical protein
MCGPIIPSRVAAVCAALGMPACGARSHPAGPGLGATDRPNSDMEDLAPIVGAAGGLMGAALGAAGDLGIKDEFKQQVQHLVQPGTSAIFVVVRKATPDKFLEGLRPYGGTVLRTSLTHDAEQELMEARHGDAVAAANWERSPQSAGAHA